MPEALTPLCVADDATFWPWRTWTDFARMSATDRAATAIIVPIMGMADWGLGHPYDAEEVMLMHLLRTVLPLTAGTIRLLMIPPLRFVLGPDAGCAFAVEPPVAHAALREVVQSIATAGFRRLIFVNSSPWNEELCAAASRDLRIELGLQIFRVNLSMLDLDLHPVRSKSRRNVQTLVTALLGTAPETLPPMEGEPAGWGDERVLPLSGAAVALESAGSEGAKILATAAARLVALLGEIAKRPPLSRDGGLVTMTPPP
jgi:creatinine amidohydrolase